MDEEAEPPRQRPPGLVERIEDGLARGGQRPVEPARAPVPRRRLSREEIEALVSETLREELERLDDGKKKKEE